MTDIIKRTTIIVRDAERAAKWYESVLGMTRWMDTPFTLSGTQLAAGKKGDQTRLIIMQAQDNTIGMIGLLQWVDPLRGDVPDQMPREIGFGTPIFVVAAPNVSATVKRAHAAGSHVHCEPQEWTVTGAEGQQMDMLGASFWDLDGNFFEVNQTLRIYS